MEGVAAGFFFAIAAAMKTAAAAAASIYPDCVYCPFLSVWKSRFIIHATIAPLPSPIFPLVFFLEVNWGEGGCVADAIFASVPTRLRTKASKSGVTTLCCHATNNGEKGKLNKSIVVASEKFDSFCCCALPLYLGNPTDPFLCPYFVVRPCLFPRGDRIAEGNFA